MALTSFLSGPGWRLPRWPGWSRLPREGRDTLFLLGVIGWTVLPHVPHLPAWCTALTALMLLLRAALAVGNGPLPGRWLLVAFYRSNGLKLFRIDAESGRLSDAGPALESPAPLSVTFLN